MQEKDSHEVVKEMLHFIYTGSLSATKISEVMAKHLLRAGDQYHLDLLRSLCEDALCSILVTGNSVEYLVLGDLYHASKLKRMALSLVAANMSTIAKTEDYKNFHKNHPELSLEVILTNYNKDDDDVKERGSGK